MVFMLVETSEGPMSVPVFDTSDEVRDAWDARRLKANMPFVYQGHMCEVVAIHGGALVMHRCD